MDIIDLDIERVKRMNPEPEFMKVIDGEQWFLFSASYTDGIHFSNILFWAVNTEEALARINLMRDNLTLDGQIFASMDG
jgi:hypothetical protein